jgi:hypothetical protein
VHANAKTTLLAPTTVEMSMTCFHFLGSHAQQRGQRVRFGGRAESERIDRVIGHAEVGVAARDRRGRGLV